MGPRASLTRGPPPETPDTGQQLAQKTRPARHLRQPPAPPRSRSRCFSSHHESAACGSLIKDNRKAPPRPEMLRRLMW